MNIPISYNQSPLDLIRSRTSVRRFTSKNVAGEVRQELKRCCQAVQEGPFGGACRFQQWQEPLSKEEHALHIRVHHLVPTYFRELAQRCAP